MLRRARRLLAQHPIIDGHNDLAWAIRNHATAPRDVEAYDLRKRSPGDTDLARLRAGGVGGQFWSVYIPGDAKAEGFARLQLEQIDIARRVIARYPERLALCLGTADILQAFRRRRVASLLGVEGGHAIENSLGALRAYYDLGVRYMTLTHNVTHDWADAASDASRHGGLTAFGEEVIREMNRLGMLVDLAHVSPAVMDHALRVSEAPVIFSHSSCRALTDVPRNVPDAILSRLGSNGGVVMITFVGPFVSPDAARAYAAGMVEVKKRTEGVADRAERRRIERAYFADHPLPKATIAQVADHVDHARRLAGVNHVGIGGDYDGNEEWPVGLEDTSGYPRLFAELIRRGWRDAELAKLASGNLLRAFRGAEATARLLQRRRPPSTTTIERLDGRGPAR
ncbi:MAG TPA: dipeptidase [Methylomirabilota bacterium]|nr:dipeptidase [Methylomirabilota bacterium]